MTEPSRPIGATNEQGLSRREVLVRSALAASSAVVGVPLLAACGDNDTTTVVSTAPGQTITTAGATVTQPGEVVTTTAEPSGATSPHPGTVAAGLANAFVGFNPALSPQLASITVIRHVFEALMQYDPASQTWTPWLLTAEPERTAANTFTATIREGATFHDGSPLTAADVAWTFDYYKNPDTGSFFGTFLQTIEKVEGDGTTLTITVTEELPNFHFALSIPMIMPKAAFEAAGNDAFSAAPVGSGPYRFATQTPGQKVSLERYAEYAGTTPGQLEKIDLNYFVEDASRIVQLTSGQLDVIDGVPYRDIGTLAGDTIDAGSTDGGRHSLVEMNQFNGPFKDEKVRQAFLYALDRDKLIEAVFPGGNAVVADSQLPPYHPYFAEPSTVYRYDPDKAKSLLAEAGHPDGFEFELMVSTIPWLTQLGTLMKEQLDAVGMKGTIRLTETEAGYGVVATKEYDVYVAYGNWYAIGRFADVPYRAFNYGAGRDGFYGKVEGRDDEYDRLVDAAFAETTEEAQIQAYLAAQELFSKSVFNNYIILWTKVTGAWQRYVTGYSPPEDDIPSLVNVSA
jgi:peptide/nickel transport system substrate-binding protein